MKKLNKNTMNIENHLADLQENILKITSLYGTIGNNQKKELQNSFNKLEKAISVTHCSTQNKKHMENNLMEISKRLHQLKSELLHNGYTGDMLENHITDVISDEILSELGEIERYDDVKRALVNMFFMGQLSK